MHKKAYAKNFSNGKPIKHLLFNHLVQMIVLPSHLTGVFMLISQASQFPADYLYCRHYLSGLSSRYKLHLAAGNLVTPVPSSEFISCFKDSFAKPVINNHMKTLNKKPGIFTEHVINAIVVWRKSRGHKKLTASLPDINFVIAVTTAVANMLQNICLVA